MSGLENPTLTALSKWARYRSVAYLVGRGIVFGADQEVFPNCATAPGQYAVYVDTVQHPRIGLCDTDLSVLGNDKFDYVFAGTRLLVGKLETTLRELTRKLKVGGHLILFLPTNNEPEAPTALRSMVGDVGSWIAKDSYIRDNQVLQIYKKILGSRGIIDRQRSLKPRACVVRYGALGDMIMVTPLIRRLAEDGFDVTVNCTRYSAEILQNNPYVSNILLQEREAIPNPDLGEYWNEWKGDYDRYINLSESIEGRLLKVQGRRDFYTHQSWRHEQCNRNYYDFTLELGGYPEVTGRRGELYLNGSEEREARRFCKKFSNKFLVLWSLSGSSHHKIYGLFEPVVIDWLSTHPDAVVVTVGDQASKKLEFEHPRLVPKSGVWPLRMSLAMTKHADLVVGPESVMTNAAGCFDTAKIVFLSHSSHENFCKYFENHIHLEPDPAVAPCYPCHALHYVQHDPNTCPLKQIVNIDTGEEIVRLPACSVGISGEQVIAALDCTYAQWKQKSAAAVA